MNEQERNFGDLLAIELKTKFQDFTERYERDQMISNEWRKDTTERLKIHCEFVKRVSPIYQQLCWVLGLVAVSTVGIAITAFWKHVYWK